MEFTMDKEGNIVKENLETQPKEPIILVIPVIEEEVIIDKKVVEKGNFIITKKVNTEEVTVEIPVFSEHLDIERVTVNQYLDNSPPAIRYEGDTMVIPVLKEVIVKRLLLVEEIRVTKKIESINKSEKIIIRKEEVTIGRREE